MLVTIPAPRAHSVTLFFMNIKTFKLYDIKCTRVNACLIDTNPGTLWEMILFVTWNTSFNFPINFSDMIQHKLNCRENWIKLMHNAGVEMWRKKCIRTCKQSVVYVIMLISLFPCKLHCVCLWDKCFPQSLNQKSQHGELQKPTAELLFLEVLTGSKSAGCSYKRLWFWEQITQGLMKKTECDFTQK